MKRLLLTLIAVMPVNAICQTPGSRAPRTFPPKTPGWVSEPAITAADLRARSFPFRFAVRAARLAAPVQ